MQVAGYVTAERRGAKGPRARTLHPIPRKVNLYTRRRLLQAFLSQEQNQIVTRHEYAHSLSYQATTFTRSPSMTFVSAASTIALLELCSRSDETTGSSVYARIPFSSPSAAALSAPLISASDVFLPVVATRSINETSGVGTRIEYPSSLPLSAGITSPMAFAAPVVVGIMFNPAARARRKSLCGKSSTF